MFDPRIIGVFPEETREAKAALLLVVEEWLSTEQFDRTLPHSLPRGEAVVELASRNLSNTYASRRRAQLISDASRAGIDHPTIRRADTRVAQLISGGDAIEELTRLRASLVRDA